MAEMDTPVEKVKSLDGSVSEPIGNSTITQTSNHEALPSRSKGVKGAAPPGQTLNGKQEHCMCEFALNRHGTPNADTVQTSSAS